VHGSLRGKDRESLDRAALRCIRPALLPQDVQVQRGCLSLLEAEAVQRPLCLLAFGAREVRRVDQVTRPRGGLIRD